MTTIYLAARYSRYPELQSYAKDLEALGHTVTSRWIKGDHEIRADGKAETDAWHHVWAQEDYTDLVAAEVCISFTEGPENVPGRARGGRHTEYGIALALGKCCIVIGYRENVFHWLDTVAFYPTWDAFLAAHAQFTLAWEELPHAPHS
jgi:hypothetical protein